MPSLLGRLSQLLSLSSSFLHYFLLLTLLPLSGPLASPSLAKAHLPLLAQAMFGPLAAFASGTASATMVSYPGSHPQLGIQRTTVHLHPSVGTRHQLWLTSTQTPGCLNTHGWGQIVNSRHSGSFLGRPPRPPRPPPPPPPPH